MGTTAKVGVLSGAAPGCWQQLPQALLEQIGALLDAPSWAAARQACRSFAAVTHGIKLLEIDVERDAHRWMMVLTCVARLFPRLSSVVLLCGSRITPAIFAERMAALAITSIQLEELELRFLYLSNPRVGTWLEDLAGVTELRHLRLLRLAGGATPPPAFFESLTSLRKLRALELLPGVYGQIAGFDMDMLAADADDGQPSGNMGVCDHHLEAIGHLTQLKNITLRVCPHETTAAGLAGLTAHGLLSSLEHLSLYDAELPCASLAEHLSGASKLTALQFGLNSVCTSLAALTRIKSLQEVSLDTAFLPSLQDLVLTAGRAHIPAHGPGAISGLCLLDQSISGPQQLACLSHFSSLSELVLVNPLAQTQQQPQQHQHPHPGAAAALAAADAANAPAAAGDEDAGDGEDFDEVLQPQQQPPTPVDLAVLSGLTNLRLLQVDLALRSGAAGGDGPQALQPLPLRLTQASIAQLVPAWSRLETLDLSGFGGDLLPEDALPGLSRLSSLRSLSIMHPDGSPQQGWGQGGDFDGDGDADVAFQQGLPGGAAGLQQQGNGGAGGGGSGSGSSQQRNWPWWQLPKGLVSLCLSHMDLSGRGACQCALDSCGASGSGGGCSSSCVAAGASSSGNGRAKRPSSSGADEPAAPIRCCLLPGADGAGANQQQQQQLLSGLSLLFQSRTPPLRPLSKRRRQTQQRTDPNEAADDAADSKLLPGALAGAAGSSSGPPSAAAATADGAAGVNGDLNASGSAATAAAAAAAAAAEAALLCSCATALPAHLSGLQALWLEHVTLPPTFLPRLLPSLAGSLESLALLHVSGTRSEDLASLAALTSLTSLRLIPSDHDVGGLEPLLGMRHLKKLGMRLTHLQPSDIRVLGRLRSLFCLSLAAPCVHNALLPGFPSAVRLQHVEEVVARLPYCDLELQPEPDMSAVH